MAWLLERFLTGVLRLIATLMVIAGLSLLLTLGVSLAAVDGTAARTIAIILIELAFVFVATGAALVFLSRRRAFLFPNERAGTEGRQPAPAGWLLVLAVALVALPAWMVWRLLPFLGEWKAVIALLETSGLFETANSNMSGVVLVPLAAALTPPFIELCAMAAFVAGSAVLLLLLLLRSRSFPRLYVCCVVLMTGLVLASTIGARAAGVAADGVARLLQETPPRGDEAVSVEAVVARYRTAVSSAAAVLLWTLAGYLIWIPAILLSPRARATFANVPPSAAASAAIDVEAVTRPPDYRG